MSDEDRDLLIDDDVELDEFGEPVNKKKSPFGDDDDIDFHDDEEDMLSGLNSFGDDRDGF